MRYAIVTMFLIILGGCASAPRSDQLMATVNKSTHSSIESDNTEPAAKGLTGNIALEFLKQKRENMIGRIDTKRATTKLSEAVSEMDKYKSQSNIVSGTTLAVGGILAAAADYAVAGGVVTALLGGYSLYNENQRNDKGKVELISACRTVLKSGADVIDRYTDKWQIVFLKYNSSPIPDNEVESFNTDTEKTNDKVRDLIGTCV